MKPSSFLPGFPSASSAWRMSVSLGIVALMCGCRSFTSGQTLLPEANPMPNEVQGGPGPIRTVPPVDSTFRDASIHVGNMSTPQMFTAMPGATGFAILQQSSLPNVSLLRARPADYDMSRYRLVRFEGTTAGCQTSVRLPIPVRGQGDSRIIVPVRFQFALRSLYDDLSDQMVQAHVVGLFDSRLDREQFSVLFGIFGRQCYRFRAIGIQEK